MRILVVDDSSPHRRMLTAIFGRDGHEVLTAGDGEAALALLGREVVDAVVSDVRMPKLDGFQLCRALRRDARWEKLPFIFYSSVFIGGPARDLGRDVGATAYLDAKDFTPQQMAKELEQLVERHVRAQYHETLGRLLDDVDFARRYHQVVLDSLGGAGKEEIRDLVAESKRALDSVLSQLDRERNGLSERTDKKVEAAQLALLKELGEFLGDRINNPLAVIMASAQLLEMKAPGNATTEAAERITAAVGKINQVVREIAVRSGDPLR
jgi:CheY-like chemotaxis protein